MFACFNVLAGEHANAAGLSGVGGDIKVHMTGNVGACLFCCCCCCCWLFDVCPYCLYTGRGSLFLYGGDSSKEEHASFISSLLWFILMIVLWYLFLLDGGGAARFIEEITGVRVYAACKVPLMFS